MLGSEWKELKLVLYAYMHANLVVYIVTCIIISTVYFVVEVYLPVGRGMERTDSKHLQTSYFSPARRHFENWAWCPCTATSTYGFLYVGTVNECCL